MSSGYPADYRSRSSYRSYPDYRSSNSHPRSSSYDSYNRPRTNGYGYDDYRATEPRYSTGYALEPVYRDYNRYDGPLKTYYQPRNTYNYLPPQYNDRGVYTEYLQPHNNRRSVNHQPYTSPMGYRTVSDRRRGAGWGGLSNRDQWDSRQAGYVNDRYGYEAGYGHQGPYQTIDEMLGRLYR